MSPRRPSESLGAGVPTITLGGLPVAVIDRAAAADLMIALSRQRRAEGPLYFTSANGEVIARSSADLKLRQLFLTADQIVADGQPLVIASRLFCPRPLPERVATTDLFHDVARRAEQNGSTFYLLGATQEENAGAVERVQRTYPRLRIVGSSHGYLTGEPLHLTLAEINRLAPDILWLGLGVPREQNFVAEHRRALPNVGLIKTSGGLFDHLAGKTIRAPRFVQRLGFEWLWRTMMEPRRLFWRYFTTGPRAMYAMITDSH
jgi:N-acetylglucosaminyldiphosphoundecaprenol N-acetyl-beta-D-mannosaminyltransferase